jgi:hypothetical protein
MLAFSGRREPVYPAHHATLDSRDPQEPPRDLQSKRSTTYGTAIELLTTEPPGLLETMCGRPPRSALRPRVRSSGTARSSVDPGSPRWPTTTFSAV